MRVERIRRQVNRGEWLVGVRSGRWDSKFFGFYDQFLGFYDGCPGAQGPGLG